MKNYTKIALIARGLYQPNMLSDDLFILCEYCGSEQAVDCHHIDPRGMGGSKAKDDKNNLIFLGRKCHDLAESKKISKNDLSDKLNNILSQCQP